MGSAAPESALFSPLKIGNTTLQNRLVMAPLTRFRAHDDHVHSTELAKEYYSQRGSVTGTMLITEATFISPRASGYPNVPGVWSDKQIAAWKEIVKGVHDKGSFIWLQLWAIGRTASTECKESEGTGDLVSASAIPMSDNSPTPRELKGEEIEEYIQDFAQAAKNAVEGAGFDGVEIHGANGYLVDQFNQDTSNRRSDKWGGSVENRSRFCLEVSKAVANAVGADKTGIRLSPWSTFQGMRMEDPIPQFTHIIENLKTLKLAYLHLVESRISGNADVETSDKNTAFYDIWGNTSPILIAGGFKPDSAKKCADEEFKNRDVAIVFGRHFISTPDLPYRIQHGIDLAPYDRDTFYLPKVAKGYTDYPFSDEFKKDAKL